jgi:hypothetical protein
VHTASLNATKEGVHNSDTSDRRSDRDDNSVHAHVHVLRGDGDVDHSVHAMHLLRGDGVIARRLRSGQRDLYQLQQHGTAARDDANAARARGDRLLTQLVEERTR